MTPTTVGEDELRKILSPFHSASPFHYWAILELLEEDVLKLSIDNCSVDEPSDEWVDTHYLRSGITSREGRGHVKQKIRAAKFMSVRGHDMEKKPLKDSSENEPLYRFACFEETHNSPFNADVSCTEDCDPAIAEVGYCGPDRVLDAFGFTTAGDSARLESSPAHYNRSVRHRDHQLSSFYVFPYTGGTSLDGDSVYCFEPVTLPEPDYGYIARITSEAFEEHDSN